MNEILERLAKVKGELDALQAQYDADLEAVHNEYRAPLEDLRKRWESYHLVALDLNLIKEQVGMDVPETIAESEKEELEIDKRHPAQRHKLPIGDAAEEVLKQAGAPLPLDELLAKVGKLGVYPTPATFRSAIIKDARKRFVNVGRGIYALRSFQTNGSHQLISGSIVYGTQVRAASDSDVLRNHREGHG